MEKKKIKERSFDRYVIVQDRRMKK